ncbi:DsbA family protein [Alphaproteobacteria bacterium]|nr:DsbA family protein [Alphaproteobacteria bacterium]
MNSPIYFYLSFGSPYSYIAAQKIEEIAIKYHRQVFWRPVRLRNIIGKLNNKIDQIVSPKKMNYMRKDSNRTASLLKLPFERPEGDPPFDCDEAYACAYSFSEGDEVKLRNISLALISAVWAQGHSINKKENIQKALQGFHQSSNLIKACCESQKGHKDHYHNINDALESGMFGSPWIIIDNENFWGHDRLQYIDLWLSKKNS